MNATPPDPPVFEALRSRVAARIQVARPRPAAPGSGRVVDHGPWERLLADTTDGWQVDYGAVRAARPASAQDTPCGDGSPARTHTHAHTR